MIEMKDMPNKKKNSTEPTTFLYSKLLKTFKNACVNTSIHGLPRIFTTENKILRLLWTVAFLTASSYCAYLVILIFKRYSMFNTNTKIGLKFLKSQV